MPLATHKPMPAPAANGARALWVRFAQLSATQKASARRLWRSSRRLEIASFAEPVGIATPLLDCYFQPRGNGVAQHGFSTRP